jgi:hypothetical protein
MSFDGVPGKLRLMKPFRQQAGVAVVEGVEEGDDAAGQPRRLADLRQAVAELDGYQRDLPGLRLPTGAARLFAVPVRRRTSRARCKGDRDDRDENTAPAHAAQSPTATAKALATTISSAAAIRFAVAERAISHSPRSKPEERATSMIGQTAIPLASP